MDFEDILIDVGDNGRYQKRLILYYVLITATYPWVAMNVFFTVSVPDHWCYVPEVTKSNLTVQEQKSLISPPLDSHCQMYDINYTQFIESGNRSVANNTPTTPCTDGWDYDKTHYDYTAATQWNMFCADNHYPMLVLTLTSVGSFIGTPIYGYVSDKFGRRKGFLLVVIVTVISSFASVMTTDFLVFLIFKTINGSMMPCMFQIPYIIVVELVAPESRTLMNGVSNISWSFGMLFLPLIAYLTRNWVTLGLVTGSMTLFAFLYFMTIPESPRWLVSQEKYEEAKVILLKIAKVNGIESLDPEILLSKLKAVCEKMKKEKEVNNVKNTPLDLIKYSRLRNIFIIISFCWIANVATFYGLQLNVTHLAGNEFLNFFLTSLPEIPGYIASWVFMNKIGRRWCCVAAFVMTGISCIVPAIFLGYPHVDIISSVLGKFSASATFMVTYQQSSELYPTVIRSLGMGISGTIAGIVSIFVPYLIYLGMYGKAIPFVVLGILALFAAAFASFLPESLNENLPQTILDTEEFGKNQKYFSWQRRKMSVSRERAASLVPPTKGNPNVEEAKF